MDIHWICPKKAICVRFVCPLEAEKMHQIRQFRRANVIVTDESAGRL